MAEFLDGVRFPWDKIVNWCSNEGLKNVNERLNFLAVSDSLGIKLLTDAAMKG
jgi:hypothetical protein